MKKLKAGVVGLNFGRFIIERCIVNSEGRDFFELEAVCDVNRARVDAAVKAYGCKGYGSLDALLEDEAVEVVVLMTGPNGRADLIRRIIRAGRDVITTKPFEVDAEAAETVLGEARAAGRFVYLNSPCAVRSRDWRVIDEWRERHRLGRPVAASFQAWHKTVEAADGSWYDDSELCFVAPVLRLGIYAVNDLVPVFGQPTEIQILESRVFTGRPTADLAKVQLRFADGALVDLMNGFTMQPPRSEDSMILYFENGTIYRNPPLWVSNHPSGQTYLCLVTPQSRDGVPCEVVRLPNAECSRAYQWNVFHKAMTTRVRPAEETADEQIVAGVRLLQSIKEADARGGRLVNSKHATVAEIPQTVNA